MPSISGEICLFDKIKPLKRKTTQNPVLITTNVVSGKALTIQLLISIYFRVSSSVYLGTFEIKFISKTLTGLYFVWY